MIFNSDCEFSEKCINYPELCDDCFLFNLLEKERESTDPRSNNHMEEI